MSGYETAHLYKLNTALQGGGRTDLHRLEEVLAFEPELTLLKNNLFKATLSHFPYFREFNQAHSMMKSAFITMQMFQSSEKERKTKILSLSLSIIHLG